jgi:4'-phosphopantetheinyl transferase EntD
VTRAAAVARALAELAGPELSVRVAELCDDTSHLLPAERALLAGVAPVRRRELATGRALARALLRELGEKDQALLADAQRVPRWPPAAVGSISHTRALCAVAVAPRARVRALGLDLEDDAPLEPGLWREILLERELARLTALPSAERGRAARLVFSAKEAVHKCQFPEARVALEFHDVEVELDFANARFTAHSSRQLGSLARAGESFGGRFARAGGQLMTLLALPSGRAG